MPNDNKKERIQIKRNKHVQKVLNKKGTSRNV